MCTAHAQTKADDAAVHNLPQAFAAAWAAHDGHQFGEAHVRRRGLRKHRWRLAAWKTRLRALSHAAAFRPFQRVDPHPSDTAAVRFLRPDLAVLHWSWRVQGDRDEDLTPRKPRFGIFTMLVEKRSGEWLVVVAQNTNWIPGPNPELNAIKPPIVFPDVQSMP